MRRHLPTVNGLLPRYVRVSLAGMSFHGMELSDDHYLMEALGRHEGCWEGAETDLYFKGALETMHIITMEH